MHEHEKESVALSSVFASAGLTGLKLFAGLMTGSLGLLSEALHSLLDLAAALITFFSIRIADRPADSDHHYGHTKVESVSALIATGLLFVTSAWIIWEAIQRLIAEPAPVEVTWYAIAITIGAMIVDAWRARALYRVAHLTRSHALEADALHFASDILSSLAVLVGLGLSYLGFLRADALAALVVAGVTLHAGYALGKRTIQVLTDAAPAGLAERILALAKKTPGIVDVRGIRVRTTGSSLFMELEASFYRGTSVLTVQQRVEELTRALARLEVQADVSVRTRFVPLTTETALDRVRLIAHAENCLVHDIAVHRVGETLHLSLDLEVPESWTLTRAHGRATRLEKRLRTEFPGKTDIVTHIDPVTSHFLMGEDLTTAEMQHVEKLLASASKGLSLTHLHRITARSVRGDWFVTLHCYLPGLLSIALAHETARTLEHRIRSLEKRIVRVVVHTEPARAGAGKNSRVSPGSPS